jgi:hypothetical protein
VTDDSGGSLGSSPFTLMTWTPGSNTYSTGEFSLAGGASTEGSLTVVGNDALEFVPLAVPEPGTWVLMLASFAFMLLLPAVRRHVLNGVAS